MRSSGMLSVALACALSLVRDASSQPRAGAAAGASAPPTALDVVAVEDAACALRSDGTVWCWGSNEHGALGRPSDAPGAPVAEDRPVQVPGVDRADRLVLDGDALCAHRTDGTWRCWGEHPRPGEGVPPSLAEGGVASPAGSPWVSRGMGASRECRLDEGGRVWCWRRFQASSDGPRVEGLPRATALAVGQAHACAVTAESGVWCWGEGARGQLGPHASDPCDDPNTRQCARRPVGVGLAGVADLAAYGDATCARLASGEVWCWGERFHDPRHPSAHPEAPTPWGGPRVHSLAMARGRLCAIAMDRSVWCLDALPGDAPESSPAPAPVQVSGVTDAVKLAVSETFACALQSDGQVRCWGHDERGQLGDGVFDPAWRALPRPVTELAAGAQVCLRLEDGSVHCAPAEAPEPVFRPVQGIAAARQVVSGAEVCALTDAGEVWCAPSNASGVGAAARVAGLPAATALAQGGGATCALTAGDDVWCWGDLGPLGVRAQRRAAGAPPSPPTRIRALRGARLLAFNHAYGCAVDGRGGARCWGHGSGCRGPVATPLLRGATALSCESALVWRTPADGWRSYQPYHVCEDSGEAMEDNCRVTLARRQRTLSRAFPDATGMTTASAPCAGFGFCAVTGDHRLWCGAEALFSAYVARVAGAAQVAFADHEDLWVRGVDGRVARATTRPPPRRAAVAVQLP